MTIVSKRIRTSRLEVHYLEKGRPGGALYLLLHGNVSSSAFFRPLMEALPDDMHCVAPDMRCFGDSEAPPVDASRGLRDFSDDLHAFLQQLRPEGAGPVHLLGWSLGAGVLMQLAMDHPGDVASLLFTAPMSPFGFGASRNSGPTLGACDPEYAGSGGGAVAPQFVDCLRTRDGELPSGQPEGLQCTPQFHARTTMNALYFKMKDGQSLRHQGRLDAATEDLFTEAMFKIRLGDAAYPGNSALSRYWPGMAPGTTGINNAISPKYCDLSGFATGPWRGRVLWIRGAEDAIVSDNSMLDVNHLGALGLVPGWPGADSHPPQPMVRQLRAVLDAWQAQGGTYREIVFEDCGHSPHIEQPDLFLAEALQFWHEAGESQAGSVPAQ